MTVASTACAFCDPPADWLIVPDSPMPVVMPKGPLAPGHLVLVSRRHVPTADLLSPGELIEMERLVAAVDRAFEAVFATGSVLYRHESPHHHCEAHCGHFHLNLVPDTLSDREWVSVLDELARLAPVRRAGDGCGEHTHRFELRRKGEIVRLAGPSAPPRVLRRALAPAVDRSADEASAWHLDDGPRHDHPWIEPLREALGHETQPAASPVRRSA